MHYSLALLLSCSIISCVANKKKSEPLESHSESNPKQDSLLLLAEDMHRTYKALANDSGLSEGEKEAAGKLADLTPGQLEQIFKAGDIEDLSAEGQEPSGQDSQNSGAISTIAIGTAGAIIAAGYLGYEKIVEMRRPPNPALETARRDFKNAEAKIRILNMEERLIKDAIRFNSIGLGSLQNMWSDDGKFKAPAEFRSGKDRVQEFYEKYEIKPGDSKDAFEKKFLTEVKEAKDRLRIQLFLAIEAPHAGVEERAKLAANYQIDVKGNLIALSSKVPQVSERYSWMNPKSLNEAAADFREKKLLYKHMTIAALVGSLAIVLTGVSQLEPQSLASEEDTNAPKEKFFKATIEFANRYLDLSTLN